MIISRLAPSPTGSLHLGNVRTFLWAWLSARAQNGRVIMRIEDLDTPRVKPGSTVSEKMLDDLDWLGLHWDEGPKPGSQDLGLESQDSAKYIQTKRRDFYREVHAKLKAMGAIYPCVCTRADVAAAQSAPHEGDAEPRYPGTCRGRFKDEHEAERVAGRPPCWRMRVPDGPIVFDDLLSGHQAIDVQATIGDFVVAKAPDTPAYQLAVVADDIDMSVNEVVRGDDLIPSTARQIVIYNYLNSPLPRYGHVPLVVGPDGKRLAKRHGDARIASLRENGVSARHVVGVLARWSGLNCPGDASPQDLINVWSWKNVSRERVVLTPEKLREVD